MQPPAEMTQLASQPGPALLDLAQMLSQRLERLSADSLWARRASGARGTLLKTIEQMETDAARGRSLLPAEQARIEALLAFCFDLLEKAARELS